MKDVNLSDINVLISESDIQERVKQIANILNSDYNGEEVCAICVLKGSVMFFTDLVRDLNMPLTMEFIRLSSYGHSTSSSGMVNAVDIKLPDLTGKNVLIVEDIVDTGITAKFLLDYIAMNFKTKSTKFVALLDKKIARCADVHPDYYCFEIDDKFVVGYGLDYDGHFRNLKFIGYADKSILQ